MCQEKITPKDISVGGIVQLFEHVNSEGEIVITIPAGQVKIADRQRISVSDTVNHLLHQIFMFDHFISHRVKIDRKHFKNAQCVVFWQEDGSIELAFNLAKLICLPCRNIPEELNEVYTFLDAIRDTMKNNEKFQTSLSILDGQAHIEFLGGDEPDNADEIDRNVSSDSVFVRNSKALRHLFSEISTSRQGLSDKALRITEESLFHIFNRPHQKHLMSSR